MWKTLTRRPSQREILIAVIFPFIASPLVFLFLIARQGFDISFFLPALNKKPPITFNLFFEELSAMGVRLPFAEQGATQVRAVRFSAMPPEVGALYNALTNVMYLPLSVFDKEKSKLKSLDQMNTFEIGAIVHELWHCYFKKVAIPQKTLHARRFEVNHWLDKEQGRVSLEEAQASYIGEVAGALVQYKRSLSQLDPLDSHIYAKLLEYQQTLNFFISHRSIYGYYTDWYRDQIVVTENPLPEDEKRAILNEFFAGMPIPPLTGVPLSKGD